MLKYGRQVFGNSCIKCMVVHCMASAASNVWQQLHQMYGSIVGCVFVWCVRACFERPFWLEVGVPSRFFQFWIAMSGLRRGKSCANNEVTANSYEGALRAWRQQAGNGAALSELIGPTMCKHFRDVTPASFSRLHVLFMELTKAGCQNACFHTCKMLVAVRAVFGPCNIVGAGRPSAGRKGNSSRGY